MGFVLFGTLSWYTIEKLKVNGKLYNKIIIGKDIVADILPPPEYIIESYLLLYEMTNSKSDKELDDFMVKFQKLEKEYYNRHEYWVNILEPGEIKTYLIQASFDPADRYFKKINSEFIPLIKNKDFNAALSLIDQQIKPLYFQHRKAIDIVVELTNKQNFDTEVIAKTEIFNSYLILSILFTVILLVVVIFSYYIIRSITKPLTKGVEFANEIANGNLQTQFEFTHNDEIGLLANNLQKMVEKLKTIMYEIKKGSENISVASNEISSSSQTLSQRANQQVESIEKVSASIEQMSSNIEQNTENAQQTNKIANLSIEEIEQGSKAINETLLSMRTIARKISVISEIANKTDLLAVNAAIEAARAGEYGKGFAVVANEIRKLADKSKNAAIEINELTQKSVGIADNAGKLFAEISVSIQNTAELVQEISVSSIEQNNGANLINIEVQQLNGIAQQNAAASEELTSNAEKMTNQAKQLQEIISFFKVDIPLETNVLKKTIIHQPNIKFTVS